jgi:hypothetical protein
MASIIRIKRSSVSGNPATLGAGELAYSALTDNGSNGGDRLYIGMGTEIDGNAANHIVIGGKFFTDRLDHTAGTLTASSAIVVDASSKIDQLNVDNLTLNGNAITSTDTNGNITITPNGTGSIILDGQNWPQADGSTDSFLKTNGAGQLSWASIPSGSFTLTGNTGTDTFLTGSSLSIVGAGSVTTAVTNDTYTISVVDASSSTKGVASFSSADFSITTGAVSLAGTVVKSVSTDSGTLTASGNSFSIIGGEGIDVTHSGTTITVAGELATTSNIGIASFNSASFAVTSGDVTIKSGGISNTQLVNSSVTIGTTTVALGATATSLTGITELTVDNLNFNGNTITSTDTNGNITLSPNGVGTVDVADSRITGVASPVNSTDATNKAYVDNAITGLSFKEAVNLLATSNIALTGSTSTLVIDGHSALDVTDNGTYRLLLTGQSTASQNGIYLYTDNGTSYALVRASDADTFSELIGASVFVMEGSTYANTGWVQSNHYLTDFSGQSWAQFSGAAAYVAGSGMTQTGTVFDVGAGDGISVTANAVALASTVAGAGLTFTTGVLAIGGTADRISVSTDAIDIASTYIGQTSITTLGTITSGTWNATTIGATHGGTGLTSYATGDVIYASATNTLAKRAAGTDGQIFQINSSGVPVWGDIDGGTY